MSGCPFYGYSGVASTIGEGPLVPTLGNQCALIVTAHAPCYMEIEGARPDAERCLIIHGVRQSHVLIEKFLDTPGDKVGP